MTLEQQIREAVARGWCSPQNAQKEMDPDLAEAIVKEVVMSMSPAPPSEKDWRTVPVTTEFLADLFDAYCGADGHNLVVSVAAGRVGQHLR